MLKPRSAVVAISQRFSREFDLVCGFSQAGLKVREVRHRFAMCLGCRREDHPTYAVRG